MAGLNKEIIHCDCQVQNGKYPRTNVDLFAIVLHKEISHLLTV